MTPTRHELPWTRIIAIAAGFVVFNEILTVPLFKFLFGLPRVDTEVLGRLGWALIAALIVVWALAFAAGRARASVEQLFAAFFVLLAGLDVAAHAQTEYLLHPSFDAVRFTGNVLQRLVSFGVLAAVVAMMLRPGPDDVVSAQPAGFQLSDLGWLWRVPASAAIYFVLFFVAGVMIWPFIHDFYADQVERAAGLLMFEWEYLNGVWFALIVLPLLRLVPGGWLRAGVTAGVLLCLIRGVASMIVQNPFMPASIRMAHMFEVGWSNFVYGLVVAYIFLPHSSKAEA